MFQDHKIAYLRQHVKVKKAVPFSMLRQGVAYIMSQGARDIPLAAMNSEIDLTALVEYTRQRESDIRKSSEKLTEKELFRLAIHKNYSAFFSKAIAHALYHVPCMNAFIDYSPWRNGGTLYHAEDINLGITVHTKYGVVRPVLRNAHQKTLEQVAMELRDLSRRARRTDPEELYIQAFKHYLWPALRQLDYRAVLPAFMLLRSMIFRPYRPDPEYLKIPKEEKLDVTEILGATISYANIGMMVPGHQTVTAIVPPEVMVIGIGDLHLAPKVVDGEIVPRTVATFCFTMDHRAYDAGEAFPFGKYFLNYLNNPALIYEWKPGDEI